MCGWEMEAHTHASVHRCPPTHPPLTTHPPGEQPDFVKTLSNLLTTVVAAADENLQLLQDTFGDAGTTACILAWHEQCERDACKILQRFVSHRQLQQLVKDVGAAHRPGGGGAAGGEGPDPRTVRGGVHMICCVL